MISCISLTGALWFDALSLNLNTAHFEDSVPPAQQRQLTTARMTTLCHYTDVIMGTIASQITSLAIVYSIVYSDADQRIYQCSASLAFVRGIHRRPVNSPHKWPVTRKMFPFDDVIMTLSNLNPKISKQIYFIIILVTYFSDSNLSACCVRILTYLRVIDVLNSLKTTIYKQNRANLQITCRLSGNSKPTHLPLVPHICVRESGQHWFR